MRNSDRLLGWRGIEKEREGKKACSVLRCPISQDGLTVSVMSDFSPCCFSKVACTDLYTNFLLTDTISLPSNPKMVSDLLHTSFGDMEMDTGAGGALDISFIV